METHQAEAKRIQSLMEHGNLSDFLKMEPISGITLLAVCSTLEKKSKEQAINMLNTKKAVHAINTRHDKPGGSRDLQQQMKDIWATGKYSSRDICVEQECAHLSMSFATARKALRGTPQTQKNNLAPTRYRLASTSSSFH